MSISYARGGSLITVESALGPHYAIQNNLQFVANDVPKLIVNVLDQYIVNIPDGVPRVGYRLVVIPALLLIANVVAVTLAAPLLVINKFINDARSNVLFRP